MLVIVCAYCFLTTPGQDRTVLSTAATSPVNMSDDSDHWSESDSDSESFPAGDPCRKTF